MSSDVTGTSRPQGDAKRGNVSVDGLAAMLSRGQPAPEAKAATPAVTPEAPKERVADTEPASFPITSNDPVAEVATPEVVTESPESPESDVLSQSDSPHEQLTPEAKAILEKRIGKEVAKTKAIKEQYEAKIRELEAKANPEQKPAPEPAPIVVQPTAENPLANINDVETLRKEFTSAQEIKRWAEDVLDSDAAEFQAGDKVFTRREVKDILRNSTRVLQEHIPARHAFLNVREAATKEALSVFPFLADKSSPEYQLAQQVRREVPFIATLPNADYIAGALVRGLRAIEADKQAAAKSTKPAPVRAIAPKAHSETPSAPARSSHLGGDEAKASVSREVNQINGKRNLTTRQLAAMLNKTSNT